MEDRALENRVIKIEVEEKGKKNDRTEDKKEEILIQTKYNLLSW